MNIRSNNVLPIVFDTSVLFDINISKPQPEIKLLHRLAAANKLSLFIPEIAKREWLSKLDDSAKKIITETSKCLSQIDRNPILASLPVFTQCILKPFGDNRLAESIELAHTHYQSAIFKLGFQDLNYNVANTKTVIDSYFTGAPPFASPKSRKDIPDALILQSVLEVHKNNPATLFACRDDALANAAQQHGITTFNSALALLRHDPINSLHKNAEFALWWEQNTEDIVANLKIKNNDIEHDISLVVSQDIIDTKISHYDIPEDNNSARIASVGIVEVTNINWTSAESLGEGLLYLPVEFMAEVELDFLVYRSETYEVEDWVNVSIGDFETDHYFEAYGERTAIYSCGIIFEYDESLMTEDITIADFQINTNNVKFEGFRG